MEGKMAAVAVLLLCCSVFTSAGSQVGCDYYTATNEDFTVPLNHELQSEEQLRWTRDGSTIFDRRPRKLLEGKEGDIYQNGSLKLTKVDKSKAGTYTPEVYLKGIRRENLKSVKLCVQDRVSKAEVKIHCSRKAIKFTCNADQPAKDLNFEWLQNNKVLESVANQTVVANSFKGFEKDSFSCRASNKVSSVTSESVKQNCVSTGILPDQVLGINIWVIVGGGGGIVLILIVVVIVCCIRNRRKSRMQVKEEEELRLGWANQQHPQHHHNHPPHSHRHHQQQPAGHTGPRQHRSKQQCNQNRPRDPERPNGQPQANPRRAVQVPRPVNDDDEKPPPLPQPRKKAPKTPRA